MPSRPISRARLISVGRSVLPGRPTSFGRSFVTCLSAVMALSLGTALMISLAGPSHADTDFFLGKWMIDKATVAPWADPARKPDDKEMKSLIGKAVTFKAGQIAGPGILACSGPTYEINEGGADMLFQGALAVKQDGSPQDPTKSAATLGFQSANIKTLQTGCENELDYHFIDDNTAEFGLNDYVYTIKR